jgi:hypothetical protein
MNKVDFLQNLVEASTIEQGFIFIDDAGHLPAPKRISSTGAASAQAAIAAGTVVGMVALGALLGGGGVALVPLFSRGKKDHSKLAVDLYKYKSIAREVGVSLGTGKITLRLGIDADELSNDYITNLFLRIHQHSIVLNKYADSFGGHLCSVAQGVLLFSQHSRAKQFNDSAADKCMHKVRKGYAHTVTQPWVIDLEDENISTCAGLWQFRRAAPLDTKGMLPRLFQRRLNFSAASNELTFVGHP